MNVGIKRPKREPDIYIRNRSNSSYRFFWLEEQIQGNSDSIYAFKFKLKNGVAFWQNPISYVWHEYFDYEGESAHIYNVISNFIVEKYLLES